MSGFHGRFLMEVGFMWSEASEAVLMNYFVFVYDADAISQNNATHFCPITQMDWILNNLSPVCVLRPT